MATLQIADKDLQSLRSLLEQAGTYIAGSRAPEASGNAHLLAIKVIRKINRELKRVHGHDCYGYLALQSIEHALLKPKGPLP